MIGLDTNVLVRFLVEDDAGQAARAKNAVQHAIERDERLFVSDVVIASWRGSSSAPTASGVRSSRRRSVPCSPRST